ncbi:MAG: helix-turn-helix transcriptional regulator [Bradyrhizobium sp.]
MTGRSSHASALMTGSRPAAADLVRLLTAQTPREKRPDLLRGFSERLGVRYDVVDLPDASTFELELALQALPGLQILYAQMHGALFRRTREDTDSTEDVGLLINSGAGRILRQRGKELELAQGEATLISLTDPLETTNRSRGGLVALRFPRPQFSPRLLAVHDNSLRAIPRQNAALRLLTGYLSAAREASRDDPGLRHAVVSHIYDLTALAIGTMRDDAELAKARGGRAARLHAIKRDIAVHLSRADLTLEAVARRQACTVRAVQRLFENDGSSFTDYVLEQRTALAHRLLTDPVRAHEKISAIAYDAGFGDVSHFNRSFRRRYGETPSDVRVRHRGER